MSESNEMRCGTCGQRVSIYSSGEGTNSYVGEDAKKLSEAEAEIKKLKKILSAAERVAISLSHDTFVDERRNLAKALCEYRWHLTEEVMEGK